MALVVFKYADMHISGKSSNGKSKRMKSSTSVVELVDPEWLSQPKICEKPY